MTNVVSGEEFSRWMNEQANFRSRLEVRMAERDKAIMDVLVEIKEHLAQLNGKTARNTEKVAILDRDFTALQSESRHIEELVESIKSDGCSQYATHAQVLREVGMVEGWSRQKKMAVTGALVGSGTLLWPALTEIAKAIHAVLEHLRGAV